MNGVRCKRIEYRETTSVACLRTYKQITDERGIHPRLVPTTRTCRSLEMGKRLVSKGDLSPVRAHSVAGLPPLSDAERHWVLGKLGPHQRIFALRDCLDRDMRDP